MPPVISVDHRPLGPWQFDESVTACFDDMLARSIPEYRAMRDAVTGLALSFHRPETAIIDIGCSRGAALRPLIDRIGTGGRFVGLEISEPMLAAARSDLADSIAAGICDIRQHDLREGLPAAAGGTASVVLSVLTLQFVPIEYRQQVITGCYRSLEAGGALLLVEKVLGQGSALDDRFTALYYARKAASGYNEDAIRTKRRSLEGVLVPVTASWNEDMLKTAGFEHIECFWRWMNFAGWVAVK